MIFTFLTHLVILLMCHLVFDSQLTQFIFIRSIKMWVKKQSKASFHVPSQFLSIIELYPSLGKQHESQWKTFSSIWTWMTVDQRGLLREMSLSQAVGGFYHTTTSCLRLQHCSVSALSGDFEKDPYRHTSLCSSCWESSIRTTLSCQP